MFLSMMVKIRFKKKKTLRLKTKFYDFIEAYPSSHPVVKREIQAPNDINEYFDNIKSQRN